MAAVFDFPRIPETKTLVCAPGISIHFEERESESPDRQSHMGRVRSNGRILSRRGDEILSRKANDGLLSQVPSIPQRLRCNPKRAMGFLI
jgi:hypothetical protein